MAKVNDEFHANKVYAEQLFPLGHGMPLWEPEPNGTGGVEIGDVGYIQDGGFYRLFNATRPADDTINEHFGCPEAYRLLVTNDRLCYRRPHAIPAGSLCSKSIKRTEVDVQAAVYGAGGGLSFTYTGGRGAILNLLDPATRMRLHEDRAVVEYMSQNFDSWYHFATETLRMDLHHSDIIFVRGWMKTSRWAVAAFAQGGQSGTLTFNINPAFPAGASLNISVSKDVTVSHQYRVGPLPQAPEGSHLPITHDELSSHPSVHTEQRCDQCIFLHYYKMRSRFWRPRVVKAASGPQDLQEFSDDEFNPCVPSSSSSPISEDLVLECIPGTSPVPDPVDDILDYILSNSDANIAIAHDGEVYTLYANLGVETSDNLPELLKVASPSIEVNEHGVGVLSLMDQKHLAEDYPAVVSSVHLPLAKINTRTPHSRETSLSSEPPLSDTPSPSSPLLTPHSNVMRMPLPRRSSKRSATEREQSAPPTSQKKRKSVTDENETPMSVLIVDDNPINQSILSVFMRKNKIKYDIAGNGEEAVKKWRTGNFRLILMDLQMPVMDGIEATKEIRRMEKADDTGNATSRPLGSLPEGQRASSERMKSAAESPTGMSTPYRSSAIILALTASSLQSDRTAALSAGCNDFLTKPVSLHWLNSKIVEWGEIKTLQT